jgi:hypothetical protein
MSSACQSIKLTSLAVSGLSKASVATLALAITGLFTAAGPAAAQGYWTITQTSIQDADHPQVDNSGELVWESINGGGIFSSVRGMLSSTGIKPALANSGEVVYADWFGGHSLDLVSTTRGRLTTGGVIVTNTYSPVQFDVNSSGEVVYTKEVASFSQVFSTVRGQVTFDLADHYDPCINDNGEIIWRQWGPLGTRTYSTTRGILPASYGDEPHGLNNLGEVCFSAWLQSSPTTLTTPHIASSSHGVIINDPAVYQWDGSINDSGTIVWDATDMPGTKLDWKVYEALWVVPEPSLPAFGFLAGFALLGLHLRKQSQKRNGGSRERGP